MFLRIIFFLALVAAISLGVSWLLENEGTVEFMWLGYKINTSITFFIFILALIIILLVIMVQILSALISFPKKLGKKYQNYQLEQNLKNLQIGYAALLSGDHIQAKKYSEKLLGSPSKHKSLGNLSDMLAAKVAQEEGNLTLAQDYFNKFKDNKKQRFFAVKALLDTSFQQGNIEDAINYAEEAYALKPNVKDGARSLLELYKKSGRFSEAEIFLHKYARKHRFFKDRHNVIDVKKELSQLWYAKAKELLDHDKSISIKDKSGMLEAREYMEKALRYDAYNKDIIVQLMKIYKALKQEKKAKAVIEKIWGRMQSYELGAVYLDVFSAPNYKDITRKKLKAIESLQHISHNPEIIDKLKDKIYDVQIEY